MSELAVLLWLVLDLTDSPSRTALVGAFRTAPMFLLGLAAGSLADRFAKKHILIAAQSLTSLVAMTLLVLIATDSFVFWFAYVGIFLAGIAWTADFASRRSYFSELYSGPRLVNALSLDSAVLTGSNMMGPLIGGVAIYFFGFAGAYVTIATLYVVGLVFILTIPSTKSTAQDGTPLERVPQGEAFRTIRGNQVILAALLVTIALNLFGFPFQQMLPVIAKDVLGADAVRYGILGSAVGVGAITGSILMATGRFTHYGTLFSLGASLMTLGILAFSFSEVYVLSLLFLFATGFGMSAFSILQPVIVLQAAEPRIRGRAMGAIALCIGFNPLGVIFVGQLADQIGPQTALAILAGLGFIALTMLRRRFPSLRGRPPQPSPGLDPNAPER